MNSFLTGICFSLFLASQAAELYAQASNEAGRTDRELSFSYDNDVLFMTDQYYTSGGSMSYGRLVNKNSSFYNFFSSKRSDTLKVISRYEYGNKMFTPEDIRYKTTKYFDRPYAGWQYLRFSVMNFPAMHTANRFAVEVGVVGKMTGLGRFQEWWHEKLSIAVPKGWKYEISNEVVLNLSYYKMRSWRLVRGMDIVTEAGAKLGTGQNKLSQNITLRIGRLNPLINSATATSRLSEDSYREGETEEAIFFFGVKGEQVMSNVFIQGSLLSAESPHTEEPEEFVVTQHFGFMYSNPHTTFSIIIYRLSPEVKGAKVHRYLSLNLALRF